MCRSVRFYRNITKKAAATAGAYFTKDVQQIRYLFICPETGNSEVLVSQRQFQVGSIDSEEVNA